MAFNELLLNDEIIEQLDNIGHSIGNLLHDNVESASSLIGLVLINMINGHIALEGIESTAFMLESFAKSVRNGDFKLFANKSAFVN